MADVTINPELGRQAKLALVPVPDAGRRTPDASGVRPWWQHPMVLLAGVGLLGLFHVLTRPVGFGEFEEPEPLDGEALAGGPVIEGKATVVEDDEEAEPRRKPRRRTGTARNSVAR